MRPTANKLLISNGHQGTSASSETPRNAQIVARPHTALQTPAEPLHIASSQSLDWNEVNTGHKNPEDWILVNGDGRELAKTEIRQRKPEPKSEALDDSIYAPASLRDESEDDTSTCTQQISNTQTTAKEPATTAPVLTQAPPKAELATSSHQIQKLSTPFMHNVMGSCFILSVAAISFFSAKRNDPAQPQTPSGITFRFK